MSIKFTTPKQFKTGTGTALLKQQNSYSVSFFYRYELDYPTSASNMVGIVGRQYCASIDHGNGGANVRHAVTTLGDSGGNANTTYDLSPGTVYHLALVYDQGHQYYFVNGVKSADFGTLTEISKNTGGYVYLGGLDNTCAFSVDDLCVWHGYVLTPSDVLALRGDGTGGADPTTIGGGASARYRWKLQGTAGQAVVAGAGGLLDDYGHSDSHFNAEVAGSTGTAVYAAPLVWIPAVELDTARVATSGKMVFFDLRSKATGDKIALSSISTYPTVSINGGSAVAWNSTTLWNTQGRHTSYGGPITAVTAGDSVRIQAPTGWATTAIGLCDAIDQVVENRTGQSNFGGDTVDKTMRLGLGLTPAMTGWGNWLLCANQRYRMAVFGATRDALGKPLTISSSPYRQYFSKANWSGGNGLDSTSYPGQVGYFAVGWDATDNAGKPISFKITDQYGSTGDGNFTITERTAYNNAGTANGARLDGVVRVFEVTRSPSYASADVELFLEVTCAGLNLAFENLWILGPGDFDLGTPTVLDKSDPFRLAARFRDRVAGIKCCRYMETTIGSSGLNASFEPEHLMSADAFSWGEGNFTSAWTFGISAIRPLVPATSPYVYHTTQGSKFAATLTNGINASQTTIDISDAATAPVFASLRLFIDNEVLRVDSVSGTTVTVTRGMEGTTAASHSAGSIQVGYRFATPGSFTVWENDGHVVEFVTTTPHKLTSGIKVEYSGSGWPASLAFTNGSTNLYSQFAGNIWVTGPTTYISHNYNDNTPNGCFTLSSTYGSLSGPTASFNPGVEATIPREVTGYAATQMGADLWVNLNHASTNDLIDEIARRILANTTPGRRVYLELSVEPWNAGFSFRYFRALSYLMYSGDTDLYKSFQDVSHAAYLRFKAIFAAAGRGSEIKHVLNIQDRQAGAANAQLDYAAAHDPVYQIDAIATGPYVSMPDYDGEGSGDTISGPYADDLDIDQRIDLYIHHLYSCVSSYSFPAAWDAITGHVADYNTATGFSCEQVFYEGGLQLTFGTREEQRDFYYHPNLYFAELDWYALQQSTGVTLSNPFNLAHDWYQQQYLWGFYHHVQQDHGRGDGSDGKANNLLCLARPGQPNTKSASVNQDLTNVSVRGQAWLDWNAVAFTSPKRIAFRAGRFRGRRRR